MKPKFCFFVTVTVALGALPILAATYTTIDYPGAIYTSVNGGPSPNGDLVGIYEDTHFKVHGFVMTADGTFSSIDYPNAISTQINGWVDPKGEIVGQFSDSSSHTHGFTLYKGTFTQVDYPNAYYTALNGVNPQGNIIGTFCVTGHCGVFTLDKKAAFHEVTVSGATLGSGATISPTGAIRLHWRIWMETEPSISL